jgi:hypothetical protein
MVICFKCNNQYERTKAYFECPICKCNFIKIKKDNCEYKYGICCVCKYTVLGNYVKDQPVCLCCRSKCRNILRLIKRHNFKSYYEYLCYKKRLGVLSIYRKKSFKDKMTSRFLSHYLIKKGISPIKECKICKTKTKICLHHEYYPRTLVEIKKAFNNKIYYVCKICHNKIHQNENNRITIKF